MNSKPVNLRQYRKRKAREDKAEQGEANRVLHGTPKAVRDLVEARKAQADAKIDAHKRDKDQSADDDSV